MKTNKIVCYNSDLYEGCKDAIANRASYESEFAIDTFLGDIDKLKNLITLLQITCNSVGVDNGIIHGYIDDYDEFISLDQLLAFQYKQAALQY